MRLILNGINGPYLREIIDNAARDTELVRRQLRTRRMHRCCLIGVGRTTSRSDIGAALMTRFP